MIREGLWEGEMEDYCLVGIEFLFRRIKNVLEMGS